MKVFQNDQTAPVGVPGDGDRTGLGRGLHRPAPPSVQDRDPLVTSPPSHTLRTLLCVNHRLQVTPSFILQLVNVMIRVATFNDCEDAAKELQLQISEAREDLRSKGFNFEEKPEKKTD